MTAGDDAQMSRLLPVKELFEGALRQEIVILCERWHLSFKLGYRDSVTMVSERGLCVAHTTILRGCSTILRSLPNDGIVLLAPVRGILADGRDVYKGARPMDVPVPSRRQGRQRVEFHLSRKREVSATKVSRTDR